MLSIDILAKVWFIALILFFVRTVAVIVGAYIGASMAGGPPEYKRISWMAYITQAGVGLGLADKPAALERRALRSVQVPGDRGWTGCGLA